MDKMNPFTKGLKEAQNYNEKTICCFVVDVSGSMYGSPIQELNKGLQDFYQDIKKDNRTRTSLEIAIVTFGSNIELVLAPNLVDSIPAMPLLHADGSTRLADGVKEAIKIVEDQKKWYKATGQSYKRPWIVLISDGAPDSNQNIPALAQQIQQDSIKNSYFFYPIGVDDADTVMLQTLCVPPVVVGKLQHAKFADFFHWLSASISMVAASKEGDKISLPNPSDWMSGFSI